MPQLISSLDELNLNPTNSQHNGNLQLSKSLGPERIMENDVDSGVTQGDKLRALKGRRPPRPSTTGTLSLGRQDSVSQQRVVCFRVEEMKMHSRTSTQPLRLSMGMGQGPPSPLKASKFASSSASAAAKRIGRSSSGAAANLRSSALSSRLASSLSDLYASLPASASSSVSSTPVSRLYGNSPEVNNNNSISSISIGGPGNGNRGGSGALYMGPPSSAAVATTTVAGKSSAHLSREWAGPYRAPGGYSGLKGGRYLSRSIPSLQSEFIQY